MKTQPTPVLKPTRPRSEDEWDGFRFTAYSLDKKVWNLPLTRKAVGRDAEESQTTVGEIYESLDNCHIKIESGARDTIITTDTGETVLDGLQFMFNLDVLKILLDLRSNGVNPFTANWFWYDRDSVKDMPQRSYIFFVVHDDKIVREHVSFSDFDSYDYARFGFDPSIFREEDDSYSVWRNDMAWKDARTRFWYRKFYTETRSGQLMVLRSDQPAIFDSQYHRGISTADLLSQNVPIFLRMLSKIHVLLWVLIVLAALILMRLLI